MRPILILLPTVRHGAALCGALESIISHGTGLADILTLGGGETPIEACNAVPHQLLAQYEIIGIACDDIRMLTDGWDKIVFEKLTGKIGVVWGEDGIQHDRFPTHPFFSSKIPLALGYVMPPLLHHYYGDNWFVDLLRPLGLAEFIPGLVTEHLHWSVGKSGKDATYQRSERWLSLDSTAYAHYCAGQMQADRDKIRLLITR